MTPTTTMNGAEATRRTLLRYEPKNFDALYGMAGFSEELLSTHFKLYEGYVANTNALIEELSAPPKEGSQAARAEERRRFGWEFNGMRLHEYYFENLGGDAPLDAQSPLHRRLCEQFGSLDAWKEDFTVTGSMRGIGWAILYEDVRTGHFFNVWVEEHNANHLSGCHPLLVLDAFEHAYLRDYGIERKKYIQAFFMNVDWRAVMKRSLGTALGRL